MPTLPLFDPTAHPDGWHNVLAPGGYEWWHFEAEDESTDTQIVVTFMAGAIFHPGYLRAYDRYMKRPTKRPPPIAADYPCVFACVYRNGKIWKQFFTQHRREDFSAARDRVEVRIGENNWIRETDTGLDLYTIGAPWHPSSRGPVISQYEVLSIKLSFVRAGPATAGERRFLSRRMTGADHYWAVAAPHGLVTGTARETRALGIGGGGEVVAISGRGCHDHHFGTAPIRDGVRNWLRGRAMFGDRMLVFHHVEPKSTTLPAETHLIEADSDGSRDLAVDRVDADWSGICRSTLRPKYPLTLRFGDELMLVNPRVIDASPFNLRLTFDAVSRGETAKAFCELVYPHRLAWPILGRLFERRFDKRPAQK